MKRHFLFKELSIYGLHQRHTNVSAQVEAKRETDTVLCSETTEPDSLKPSPGPSTSGKCALYKSLYPVPQFLHLKGGDEDSNNHIRQL